MDKFQSLVARLGRHSDPRTGRGKVFFLVVLELMGPHEGMNMSSVNGMST